MKAVLRGVVRLAQLFARGAEHPRFHWSSLMDDRGGCDRCPIWSGRCWWHVSERRCLRAEWHWFTLQNYRLGAEVQIGGGDSDGDVRLHLAVPWLCNLYLTWEGYLKPRVATTTWEAAYLLWGGWGQLGTLSVDLGYAEDFYGRRLRGWRCHVDLADKLLGRERYEAKQIARHFLTVRLPDEPDYEVVATVERCTWTRPRWPRWPATRTATTATYEILHGGIPIPGKGENSWDQGEDAYLSISGPVADGSLASVQRGMEEQIEGILKRRIRYGGEGWKPARREVAAP